MILIRSIYRVIEYAQGNSGYVISHEVFIYVFDATMMFLVMIVMNDFHPSVVLKGNPPVHSKEQRGEHNETELEEARV
ncbi:RTA1 like protein [Penicillium angulare]|uniref:RTA1 like protein n=1 Tax=Penicillium angulare TaxID=116970 RepID=UPI002540B94A|nr:RTA1 like protein [Penicillium angulare]KAJ5274036.1 RTA1 like protein [Penicillium angulare]